MEDWWEADFMSKFDLIQTIDLLQATNYLNMNSLFELCCASVGASFRGKNFDTVKKEFGLEQVQYTPEDDEKMMATHPWILQESVHKSEELNRGPPMKKK